MTIRVEGAADLRRTALLLKAAGERELLLAMRRNIRLATLPAKRAVQASAMATLPKSGGLNEWVASANIGTRILTGPRSAGVRVVQSRRSESGKRSDLKKIDAGQVRHRVYGRWVKGIPTQSVPPGFFTRPLVAMRPNVTAACVIAMRETSRLAGFKG